jgi:hypothetical protein
MKELKCQFSFFSFCKNYFFILILVIFAAESKAQSYSTLIFDESQSQNFGASNLLTLHKALYSFEDRHIRDTLFRENTFLKKAAGFGYRMAKLYLLDAQIDGFIALAQHEAFGHGARYREFGYKENAYGFSLYPPFGTGHGFTQRGTLRPGFKYTTYHQNIASAIGGVDAEKLLADNLTSQILLDDTLHYRQGLIYLISQNNLPFYLFSTRYSNPENIKPNNDMVAYITEMNYFHSNLPGYKYDVQRLSNQSLISFINPVQVYSAFSILYTYGIRGKKQLRKIPMFKFGGLRYLPGLNYSLTPFGAQYHFINYFRYQRMLFFADLNYGDNTFFNFHGISLKGYNVVNSKRITVNVHLDGWNQPELALDNYSTSALSNKTGGAAKVDLLFRPFIRENKIGIFIQAGYKTKGYLTGEPLAETFIIRYGLSFHL